MSMKLPATLKLGAIELHVKYIDSMKNFYKNVLGFDLMEDKGDTATLGLNSKPIILLHGKSGLSQAPSHHAGLYHFAILYETRKDLAHTVYKILKEKPEFFSGSADHLVSEAFYFSDPEGNGIELYFDRDKKSWEWEGDRVKMASIYIDPVEYIRTHAAGGLKGEIKMGHFHLKVGDITTAKQFYGGILGFEVTAELPGALFLSVGKYHHHIGLNTWESYGAGKRPHSLGLKTIEFLLPGKNDVKTLMNRLKENKIDFIDKNGILIFQDPWGNEIRVKSD